MTNHLFARLLAIGGVTTATTVSIYVSYKHSSASEKSSLSYAKCRSPSLLDIDIERIDSRISSLCKWNRNWDFREPEKPSLSTSDDELIHNKPTATRHIFLIRHGHYNTSSRIPEMRTLTEIGKKQALLTMNRFQSRDIKFNRLIVSSKLRAQETGEIIREGCPHDTYLSCSLLEEGAPYHLQPEPDIYFPTWTLDLFRDNPRIEAAFRKYIHRADPAQKEDSYDLLVCHGNVIRYFVCRALQLPLEGWSRFEISNCGVTWLRISPSGRVSLREFNSTGHMPSGLIT